MSSLLNFAIGVLTTGLMVLAIIYIFNRFTPGGVASLGKEPITKTLKAA